MTYVDAHSHLADPRLDSCRSWMIQNARAEGIGHIVQGGVGPEDWQRQLELKAQIPEVAPVFGLHPYWVNDHSQDECEAALDQLAVLAGRACAIGEAGLDLRPQYADSQGLQTEIFQRQIEIACFARKPVVLHLVQAHEEAMKILSLWELPAQGGIVHAFNGSVAKAQDFLSYGLKLSIGGAVCRANNQRLHQAIKTIGLESLVIESDTPDQAPPPPVEGQDLAPAAGSALAVPPNSAIPENFSQPTTILRVAAVIAQIQGLSTSEVLDRTSQNARKLFSL
jgi:TatD DNase family protein